MLEPIWILALKKSRGRQQAGPQPSPRLQLQPPRPKGVVLNKPLRHQLVDVAASIADKYGIPRNYFIAQIQRESGFNPSARGKAGEIGIAQIIPRYHPGVNPHDPIQSMEYLAQFLVNTSRQMAAIYGPDLALPAAVAAWNAGTPSIASGRIPRGTVDYIANIFGPDVAGALLERAAGKTLPPAQAWAGPIPAAPPREPPLAPVSPSPLSLTDDHRLKLILEGLLLLPPEILAGLPRARREAVQQLQRRW